jgi:beta-lactam-binding protein with PASTA domain
VMGAGVQGLAEAPWLNLDTPAATNGWWAREWQDPGVTGPPAIGPGTGPLDPGLSGAGPVGSGFGAGHSGTGPSGTWQSGTGPSGTGPSGVWQSGSGPPGAGQPGSGGFGSTGFGAGQPGSGGFGSTGFGAGQPGGDGLSSRTLVVHREDGGRYQGGREPFLQRWLFSPRLAIVALVLALGIGLGLGGWWFTSGRYASIPVVAGDSVNLARTALTTHGFTVAKVSPVPSNDVPKGTVVGTSPSGRAGKGAAVTILVSSGPFTSVVPNVHGDTLAAAQAALQRVHLVPVVQKVGSNSPVGTVLRTNPAAGTSWPQTKSVTILVAGGPAIPNFAGQMLQVAEQWASAHGAILHTQQDQNSQDPSGTITGQEPAAGSLYQPGETVIVNVSSGPAQTDVPDVIGMSVQQATQTLQAAGFKAQVQSFGFGSNPNSRVWDYSPVGQAPRGSVILLDVLPGGGGGGGF